MDGWESSRECGSRLRFKLLFQSSTFLVSGLKDPLNSCDNTFIERHFRSTDRAAFPNPFHAFFVYADQHPFYLVSVLVA